MTMAIPPAIGLPVSRYAPVSATTMPIAMERPGGEEDDAVPLAEPAYFLQ